MKDGDDCVGVIHRRVEKMAVEKKEEDVDVTSSNTKDEKQRRTSVFETSRLLIDGFFVIVASPHTFR